MTKIIAIIIGFIGLLLVAICMELIFIVLLAIPFVWCWNFALTVAVGAHPIDYFQGLGLLFLFGMARTVGSKVELTKRGEN
jgi:hypothetical protein